MPDVLTDQQVHEALAGLPEWAPGEAAIRREFEASDFLAAIAVVDAVAREAEAMDHHPDIDIRWRTLTFVCATHSAGGVTELDLELARRIEVVISRT